MIFNIETANTALENSIGVKSASIAETSVRKKFAAAYNRYYLYNSYALVIIVIAIAVFRNDTAEHRLSDIIKTQKKKYNRFNCISCLVAPFVKFA